MKKQIETHEYKAMKQKGEHNECHISVDAYGNLQKFHELIKKS